MEKSRWEQVEEAAADFVIRVLRGEVDVHPQEVAIIPALLDVLKR